MVDGYWRELENMKHCMTCKYYSNWDETPEDAETWEDCIPHSYCDYLHCVIDDINTCKHYIIGRKI